MKISDGGTKLPYHSDDAKPKPLPPARQRLAGLVPRRCHEECEQNSSPFTFKSLSDCVASTISHRRTIKATVLIVARPLFAMHAYGGSWVNSPPSPKSRHVATKPEPLLGPMMQAIISLSSIKACCVNEFLSHACIIMHALGQNGVLKCKTSVGRKCFKKTPSARRRLLSTFESENSFDVFSVSVT